MQNAFWQSGSDSRWFLNQQKIEEKNLYGMRDPPPLMAVPSKSGKYNGIISTGVVQVGRL